MVELTLYVCRGRPGDMAAPKTFAMVGPLIGPVWEYESVGCGGRAPKWLEAAPQPRYKMPGKRINHEGAHIPPPTERLVRGMALASWASYSSSMELLLDHEMPTWDNLPDPVREIWLAAAKAAYACVALYGGGTVEDVGEPGDGDAQPTG
mgnify:CR=1 FL=1